MFWRERIGNAVKERQDKTEKVTVFGFTSVQDPERLWA